MKKIKALLRRITGRTEPAKKAKKPRRPRLAELASQVGGSTLHPLDSMRRLGTQYGGWLLPEQPGLDARSICYLAGAGEDISFDCALATEFGCQVRIIDPTPRAIAHYEQLRESVAAGQPFPINRSEQDFYTITREQLPLLTYLPFGLSDRDTEMKFFMPLNPDHVSCSIVNLQGTEDYFIAQCLRLGSLMSRLGDTHIDLLKMDIEGGEYAVLDDMLASSILPRLLLVEFDETNHPLDDGAAARILQRIQALADAGMQCIAVDGCNATFMKQGT